MKRQVEELQRSLQETQEGSVKKEEEAHKRQEQSLVLFEKMKQEKDKVHGELTTAQEKVQELELEIEKIRNSND